VTRRNRHLAPSLTGRLAQLPIRFYRVFISPLKPPTCRFTPTCSAYALEAVAVHGVVRGGWLGVRRICRCHPWGGHGWDPVPGTTGSEAATEGEVVDDDAAGAALLHGLHHDSRGGAGRQAPPGQGG
jgi:putative membrane protein insertion efficiency factor